MTSKGFSQFKRLSKAVDNEIEALEKEVAFGLADLPKSEFAADVADEVLEEVQEMKKESEGEFYFYSFLNFEAQFYLGGSSKKYVFLICNRCRRFAL
jgi:hypothetical protein